MERIEVPSSQRDMDKGLKIERQVGGNDRQRAAGEMDVPRQPIRSDSDTTKGARPAVAKSGTSPRTAHRTISSRSKRAAPEVSVPLRPKIKASKPEVETPAPDVEDRPAAAAPMQDLAPDGGRMVKWIAWAKARRRLLTATGLGFLAGILVHGFFGSEESPAPPKATNATHRDRASDSDTGRDRPFAGIPSRSASTWSGYGSQQGYGQPPAGVEYSPGTGYRSEAGAPQSQYGAPWTGQPSERAPGRWDEFAPQAPTGAPAYLDRTDSWSTASPQRSFGPSYDPGDYRPWGNVEKPREQPSPPPRSSYPGYPYTPPGRYR